jgi:hypothetical protein
MLFNKFNFDLKKFTGRDNYSTREELKGIFVSPRETCATDAIQMMIVESVKGFDIKDYPTIGFKNQKSPIANFDPFIVPIEDIDKLTKIFPNKENNVSFSLPITKNAVIISADKEQVEIGINYLDGLDGVMVRPVDAKYPKYQKLIKDECNYNEVAVNPTLLKNAIEFLDKFVNEGFKKVVLKVPQDNEKPIKIIGYRNNGSNKQQKATSIIMPMTM